MSRADVQSSSARGVVALPGWAQSAGHLSRAWYWGRDDGPADSGSVLVHSRSGWAPATWAVQRRRRSVAAQPCVLAPRARQGRSGILADARSGALCSLRARNRNADSGLCYISRACLGPETRPDEKSIMYGMRSHKTCLTKALLISGLAWRPMVKTCFCYHH
jgi:hypothetical protein